MGNGCLGLLLFAARQSAWNELLKSCGLQIAWREALWCSTAQECLAASITVSETMITRRTREEVFKALGVRITFDGHFTRELAEREISEWRCRKLDPHTHTMCTSARSTDLHTHRKMIYVRRFLDECADTHMTRWARLLRFCRAKHKLPRCDEIYFVSYFSWCGHIARITTRNLKGEKQASYFCTKICCGFRTGRRNWVRNVMDVASECGGSRQWLNVLVMTG